MDDYSDALSVVSWGLVTDAGGETIYITIPGGQLEITVTLGPQLTVDFSSE